MRTLYLHIGHPKTGSSFLQSSFANSVDILAAHGIDYPGEPNAAAAGWKISSGNGQSLLTTGPEGFEITRDKVLFSAERLFIVFAEDPGWVPRLRAFCDFHDISSIQVLMFLRDPIPHAESSHQQMIKRGGWTDPVETTFETYIQPELVRKALKRNYRDLPIEWHVFNYDRCKSDLLPTTETFLGLPQGTLMRGGDRMVNRSMTAGELMVLRGLNVHDPKAAALLADALCNEVPEVASETVYPAHEVQQAMLDRLSGAIADVEALIDPAERYGVDLQTPGGEAGHYMFSARQIEVMTETLGRRTGEVTAQLRLERARRQLNLAQSMMHQKRFDEVEPFVDRAVGVLKGLSGKGDVDGLRSLAERIRQNARNRLASRAQANPQAGQRPAPQAGPRVRQDPAVPAGKDPIRPPEKAPKAKPADASKAQPARKPARPGDEPKAQAPGKPAAPPEAKPAAQSGADAPVAAQTPRTGPKPGEGT